MGFPSRGYPQSMMASRTRKEDDKQKWRKILYVDQGVPDNYVDESFLDELKKNLHIRTYDFWTVVIESGIVSQQISSVCLFIVAFVYMHEHFLSPLALFFVTTTLTLVGYILNASLSKNNEQDASKRTFWDDSKTALTFIAFGFGMSPILMTLTETISTDTIYAMTTAMLLTHLLFHDYGADSAIVSQPLSLNAAMFASVCLASRLPTFLHTFSTVTLAVAVFASWPSLRKNVKMFSSVGQVVMTALLGLSAALALLSVSLVSAVIFLLGHVFITFICPAWLIRLQPYKNNIYGPWDEAVVQD